MRREEVRCGAGDCADGDEKRESGWVKMKVGLRLAALSLAGMAGAASLFAQQALLEIPDAPLARMPANGFEAGAAIPVTASNAPTVEEGGEGKPLGPRLLLRSVSIAGAGLRRPVPWYRRPDRLAEISLAGAEALDTLGTFRNMTHRRWLCGFTPLAGNGVMINGHLFSPGSDSGAGTLARLCGVAQLAAGENYAVDVTKYDESFTEGGWTVQMGLAGRRDFPAVEAWNLALDGVGVVAQRFLPATGRGRWARRVFIALNYAHGAAHVGGGVQCLNFVDSPKQTANGFFESRADAAEMVKIYPGPRWWGRR
jgi:hypothetical protein